MRTLIFVCPRTQRDIVSGIQLDDSSLRCISELPVTLRCSCGDVHRMRVKDGRFGLESPAAPPLAPATAEQAPTPLARVLLRAAREGESHLAPPAAPIAFPVERLKPRGSGNNVR